MSIDNTSSLNILIVDDSRSIRMFLTHFLLEKGHSVTEATNGQEAIDAFSQYNPDLILMDVIMPVMTGYEAASIIKQNAGDHFVPIIFLTSLNDDESLVKCIDSGGDNFLTKPINLMLLGAMVNVMQRMIKMTGELERFKRLTAEEIELAHHVFKAVTKRMSVKTVPELSYWTQSAGHFSGDLVIYDKSPTGKLYVMLGDFTGHGFSAAIGAIPASDIFYAMIKRNFKLADIVGEINRRLNEIMPTSHFCATAFVCIDPASHQIEIFNGGLPPVLVLDSAGVIQASLPSNHLALGILPGQQFQTELYQVERTENSSLILYSDGVIEAQNAAGEMFGEERLLSSLLTHDTPLTSVKSALESFIDHHPLNDDISLLGIRLDNSK